MSRTLTYIEPSNIMGDISNNIILFLLPLPYEWPSESGYIYDPEKGPRWFDSSLFNGNQTLFKPVDLFSTHMERVFNAFD